MNAVRTDDHVCSQLCAALQGDDRLLTLRPDPGTRCGYPNRDVTRCFEEDTKQLGSMDHHRKLT